MVTTTVLLGLLLTALLGSVLYQQIAAGLVDQAVANAQRDASQQVALAQDAFDSTDRRDDTGLRLVAQEQINAMAGTSAEEGRRVMLWPALSNDRGEAIGAMGLGGPGELPARLQVAIDSDPEDQQVVVVPVSLPGMEDPVTSVVVGSRISLLRAGGYDLVLIYPLLREQETLDLVRQLFLAAGAGLVLLVAALAALATRMVTRPVAEVAKVSRELAAGRLGERLPVQGSDEIAQLATSFNTMADSIQHQIRELRSLSQLQQRFVSDVSHELRTPLTTMRMAGAVLHASRDDFALPVARSAELLDQELDRFEELLTELLEISRFDSGAVTLERHEEDIVPLVRSAADGLEPLARTHGSAVLLHLPSLPVTVSMDGRRISRVLRNLISNALEHGEGHPVEVTLAADEHVVAISVRDHGIGLSEEQQAQVFDRFWRGDPARNRTAGGTGLGLAIAQEDARVHGGWLQVGSAPGRGACFRLVLPRQATYVIADRPPPVPAPPDSPPPPAPPGVRTVTARAGTQPDPAPHPAAPRTPRPLPVLVEAEGTDTHGSDAAAFVPEPHPPSPPHPEAALVGPGASPSWSAIGAVHSPVGIAAWDVRADDASAPLTDTPDAPPTDAQVPRVVLALAARHEEDG